jgi:selenocysteine-specific elongation factor
VRDIAGSLHLDEALVRRVSRLAARRGDLEEIATDRYFLYETVVEMADVARGLAASDPGLTVIGFRDRLDNGRRVAIEILEFFDRHGLTMLRNEVRRINPHRATMFSARP